MELDLNKLKENIRSAFIETIFGSADEQKKMREYAIYSSYDIIDRLYEDITGFFEFQTNDDEGPTKSNTSNSKSSTSTNINTSGWQLKNDALTDANDSWVSLYKTIVIPDKQVKGGKTVIHESLFDKQLYPSGNIPRLGGNRNQSNYYIAKYTREYNYETLVLYNDELFSLDPGLTTGPKNPVYNKLTREFKEVLDNFAKDKLYPIVGGDKDWKKAKAKFGEKIQINSLARTIEWCHKLDGNGWSNHCGGIAADICTNYWTKGNFLDEFYNAAIDYGFGGIGIYPDQKFIHVDIGPSLRWNG